MSVTAPRSEDFYADLAAHDDFRCLTDPASYAPAPEDWHVVVTDVAGSTRAIEEGAYKAVNMAGASSIVAVLNAVRPVDVPYVFGGDGATLLLPASVLGAATAALQGLQRLVREAFGLRLRVGVVPVRAVQAAGLAVEVAKLRVAEHYHQALFTGGGLTYAERLIKAPETAARYAVPEDAQAEVDLSGLECRWQDVPSPYGETLAILVKALAGPEGSRRVYGEVLDEITRIYGDDEVLKPVGLAGLHESFSFSKLGHEARLRGSGRFGRLAYAARIWAQNGLLRLFVRFDVTTGETHWRRYMDLLVETSDFRKYDEMLRMVVSGTEAQREELTRCLSERAERGELVFGTSVSDRAHVTCVVFDRMGSQVHFVDAADGGYALAARDLKRRMAKAAA